MLVKSCVILFGIVVGLVHAGGHYGYRNNNCSTPGLTKTALTPSEDCNGNGIADVCELYEGTMSLKKWAACAGVRLPNQHDVLKNKGRGGKKRGTKASKTPSSKGSEDESGTNVDSSTIIEALAHGGQGGLKKRGRTATLKTSSSKGSEDESSTNDDSITMAEAFEMIVPGPDIAEVNDVEYIVEEERFVYDKDMLLRALTTGNDKEEHNRAMENFVNAAADALAEATEAELVEATELAEVADITALNFQSTMEAWDTVQNWDWTAAWDNSRNQLSQLARNALEGAEYLVDQMSKSFSNVSSWKLEVEEIRT